MTIVLIIYNIFLCIYWRSKANLRDLIAATGLVILPKLDANHRFFSPCNLEIWRMTSKNTKSSFGHHFKSIGEFKLELQSGNVQFGSTSAIFCPVWPWNLTDDLEKQSNWRYSPEMSNLGQNWQFFVPCNLEIWWMTWKKQYDTSSRLH